MSWEHYKRRLILFLVLIISGILILLGSRHFGYCNIEFKGSLSVSKSSIIHNNKNADKFISIIIKIPIR
jgi:hypothetical protein